MDFSLMLFIAVLVTGLVSLSYYLLSERGAPEVASKKPVLVEYARALFPVLLIVFALRAFVVEPFRIPSGSMLPNLHIGDFIAVNKYTYGIRLPLLNQKVIDIGGPARGDVMVFRYPRDPSTNYIKRVVGLPGDVITYRDKKLFINEQPAEQIADGEFHFAQSRHRKYKTNRFLETTDNSTHAILIDPTRGTRNMTVTVPAGNYFVLGDNRDHSNDSRFWRFVPEQNVVGKAFLIWFSWKGFANGGVAWGRIGEWIE